MSQQINLLNPAFRKPRDWLKAAPLAAFAAVLLALLVIAAFAARVSADGRERLDFMCAYGPNLFG